MWTVEVAVVEASGMTEARTTRGGGAGVTASDAGVAISLGENGELSRAFVR